jgi:4-diphosphocytidyl-2-C-methyl-D-erythritol kinase
MHRLQTIFQLLDFGDHLIFEKLNTPLIELIAPNCHFPNEENLAFRAARLLQETYQVKQGVRIHLDKKIPTGAGLGGGSSDAGAVLRSLNQLWELQLPLETLIAHGKSLGADVPIFVLNQNAWAEGIGEILSPLSLPKQHYLIIKPRCQINTGQMFSHPDLPRSTSPLTCEALSLHLSEAKKTDCVAEDLRYKAKVITKTPKNLDQLYLLTHNDCEMLARHLYPEVAEVLDWLNQFGPARLTGTGSCIFLPTASKERAEQLAKLAKRHWEVIVCESLI